MNQKKYEIVFGVVAIVLMMVSSAIAGTIPQTQTETNESSGSENNDTSVTNYVKPGIYLSGSEQRKILSDALNLVNDPDICILLQEIIKKMDSKGFVNSNDIEQIINDKDLGIGTVTSGSIITGDKCGGSATCLRRPFCFGVLWAGLLYWKCVACCDFNPPFPVDITIAGLHITYRHQGLAIGFIGFVCNGIPFGLTIEGSALLIIYTS